MDPRKNRDCRKQNENVGLQEKKCGRREFLKGAAKAAALGSAALVSGCSTEVLGSNEELLLRWNEYFKKHYQLMTQEEKNLTVRRLERLANIRSGVNIQMSATAPVDQVLFGYAFNVTRC